MLLLLAGFYALLVGITLGLLGGGGSILTLPLLVYLLGMGEKEGIAGSLFVVATTSLVALVAHARRGAVQWRIGLLFGTLGMAAAFLAGRGAAWIPGNYLLVGFGIVSLGAALAMMRGRPEASSARAPSLPLLRVAGIGLLVGGTAGLVGAGGGFLIVPALTLLGGLPVVEAIGTSLLVIALQSVAGFLGHATHVSLNWQILLVVASFSVLGSLVGSRIGPRLSSDTLRQSFAWVILVMAALILARETPAELLRMPATQAGGALIFLAVLGMGIRNHRLGLAGRKKAETKPGP